MRFEQHYSGSSGNFYVATANNGHRLLIDPGVTWAEIQKTMRYDLGAIDGCLITHSHKDHCKAAKDVLKAGIDVYSGLGTLVELDIHEYRRSHALPTGQRYHVGLFEVLAFNTHHDVADSLYYVIQCDGETMLFATDTSHIDQRFTVAFNIIAIECSYDKDILQERVDAETINETLAKRLLSSHMEKQNTMRYLKEFCTLTKCREVHLLHMSAENIDKEQTVQEFENELLIKVVTV